MVTPSERAWIALRAIAAIETDAKPRNAQALLEQAVGIATDALDVEHGPNPEDNIERLLGRVAAGAR